MGTSRWLLPAVLVVAGASVGTGLVAREMYQRPAEAKGEPIVQASQSQSQTALPGDSLVRLSVDAFAHPDRERVQDLFQRHFDSINQRDFDKWSGTVSRRRVLETAENVWQREYSTTQDGSIAVQRIESDPGSNRLRVLASLISTQDVSKAPPQLPEPCIRWRVVSILVWEEDELRMDVGPENFAPQREPC